MTSPTSDVELDVGDVEVYTNGRLTSGDESTAQLLAAAIAAARRYCGWHVNPVISDDEVTVDGSGGRALSLPTMNLIGVSAIDEDGVAVDPAGVRISRTKGMVTKRDRTAWTSAYGAVTVTMTHGLTNAEAADWRQGVLRLVDLMSRELLDGNRDSADMISKRIDDVEYGWSATQGSAVGLVVGGALISNDARLSALFAPFRILQSP